MKKQLHQVANDLRMILANTLLVWVARLAPVDDPGGLIIAKHVLLALQEQVAQLPAKK
ncbi:hypothetical protein K7H20_16375 [Salipiger manganoxidans]|uniref:hypothetical protein n=1 Tax=Salipiger marinus TaxID=555512 RepID=UPI001E3E87E8|nr:hypothetical protein [Salipiger manganoxidans]MCD1619636.1 hypothetical protein [Salipiger manganoxidans]